MQTCQVQTAGRVLIALMAAVCVVLPLAAGYADPVLFQDGLPEVLVIDYQTDDAGKPVAASLEGQIKQFTSMSEWSDEHQPKQGFLQKIMGASQGPALVAIKDLEAHGEEVRGQLVAVEGLLKQEGAERRVVGLDGDCMVSLPEGVPVQGFGGEDPVGLPVRITGTVELKGVLPVVRATGVTPSRGLALLRKARCQELLGQFEEAIATYLHVGGAMRAKPNDLASFARVRAGQISYNQLRDPKKTAKQYNAAWTTYVTHVAGTDQVFHTWVPETKEQTWRKATVHDAIAEPLNEINSESFWYKFVAFFVAICGGNAALGCILLAFVVRTLIWPLTKKQLESAAAMKKLQPQIKALQAKFADDKQKFQQEFWALCQANGVNPLGGCLPLIIQMPILIMVYRGIRQYVVEFDKFSFLWVDNLAGPDMPLLIAYTISMILFQKMTQKTNPQAAMDPQQEQQQKMMMYMMPLMFFFMFKTFPAAFILYWLGTNLVYFFQQWNYMRKVDDGSTEITPHKTGGFVDSMARMLSGNPSEDDESAQVGDDENPEVDKRSLEEIRREDKNKAKKRHRR